MSTQVSLDVGGHPYVRITLSMCLRKHVGHGLSLCVLWAVPLIP